MSFTIQLRRGLAATWTSENPILAQGEIGLETDTFLAKVGDGATAWTGLSYWNPNGGSGGGGAVSSVFGRTGAVTAHTGDYAVAQVTGAAPLASPALTGTPTAPTAAALTNSTQLATTAYSDSAVAVEKARAQATEALLAAGIYNVKASPYNATGNGSTDDTAAINAALLACHNAGGGTVVAPPGTYLISAPLVIYSNTLLQSSRDTIFTLAAASNCNMIKNFATTPNRSVTDAAITTGTATLTSNTAAFVSGDVGATVAVANAMPGGQVLTANILSVTNGTTVVLDTNAQNTVTAANCSIYYRDSNIEISGGTWNRNNNGYTGTGDPGQNSTQLRFIDGLYVHDSTWTSTGTAKGYQLTMAAVTNFVVKRITISAPGTLANTDGVSVCGPASRGLIDTVFGGDGDDFIAIHTNYNQGANSAQVCGSLADITVTNIFPNGTGVSAVKVNGSSGFTVSSITVRGVRGTYNAAVSFANQQPNFTDILFEDIDIVSPATQFVNLIYIQCANSLGTLTFRNVALRSYASANAINMFQVAAGSAIGTLVLENLTWEAGTSGNGSNVLQVLASAGSPTTINNIVVSKVTGQNTAAAWTYMVAAQQYTTIDTLTIRDVSVFTTQSTDCPLFSMAGAIQTVIFDGIYFNGGGELADIASTASAMQIIANNIVSYAAHRLMKINTANQCDIILTNVDVNTLNQAGMINIGNVNPVITVRGSNLLNPTNVALFNGSTPTTPARVVHQDTRVDVATIATNLGDRAWNTNVASAALGPVIYDGAKWTPVGGTSGGNLITEGLATNVRTVTTTYTAVSTDFLIEANANGGAFTVTLPTSGIPSGQIYEIKKVDTSSNAVTIAPATGQIDQRGSYFLAFLNNSAVVQWDGTTWNTVAGYAFAATPVYFGNNLQVGGTTTFVSGVYPGVSTLTFVGGGTTLVNAQLGNVFGLTLTASTTTLGNPTNPVDGQTLRFRITQGAGGSFTMAWGTAYNWGPGGVAPTLSTAAGAVDVIAFEYEAASSIWRFIGSTIAVANPVPINNGGTGQTTQQAAINALAGAVTSGDYLRGNGTNVVMSTIQSADLPAATSGAQGAVILDGTATDILVVGSQAAGANGKAADSGHVHPSCWGSTLSDQGTLLAAPFDPGLIGNGGGAISTSGTMYLTRVRLTTAQTITNILVPVAASSAAQTHAFFGLYNSSGTLVASTADRTGDTWTNTSLNIEPLQSTYAAAAGLYWIAMLFVFTVAPSIGRIGINSVWANVGLAAGSSNLRYATYNTGGLVALPSPTITTTSMTGDSHAFWLGLS